MKRLRKKQLDREWLESCRIRDKLDHLSGRLTQNRRLSSSFQPLIVSLIASHAANIIALAFLASAAINSNESKHREFIADSCKVGVGALL